MGEKKQERTPKEVVNAAQKVDRLHTNMRTTVDILIASLKQEILRQEKPDAPDNEESDTTQKPNSAP